jgi:hypothetical protein
MRELYANLSLIAEPYAKVGWIETIPLKPTPIWDDLGCGGIPGEGGYGWLRQFRSFFIRGRNGRSFRMTG